jgi:hypothetical protein
MFVPLGLREMVLDVSTLQLVRLLETPMLQLPGKPLVPPCQESVRLWPVDLHSVSSGFHVGFNQKVLPGPRLKEDLCYSKGINIVLGAPMARLGDSSVQAERRRRTQAFCCFTSVCCCDFSALTVTG